MVGGDLNAFSLRGTAESVKILQRAFPQTLQGDSLPTRGPQRLDFSLFRLPGGFETRPLSDAAVRLRVGPPAGDGVGAVRRLSESCGRGLTH